MNVRFKDEYKKKLVTVEEAVKLVKSGDWVEYAATINSSHDFDEALSKRKDELWDVKIRCDIGAYYHYTAEADPSGEHFVWSAWHTAGYDRKYIGKNLYHCPQKLHENPMMTRKDCIPTNVAVIMVTPMDKYGYFNFGASSVSCCAMIETAKTVILEVNENLPRCLGGFQENVHISQVDYVVEGKNVPLCTLPAVEPNEIDKKIASYILGRMYDGNCIQLGIGGVPNAVGKMVAQSDLKDLGVHTEMYADAYVDMSKAGKINGSRKTIDRYKQVYSFAMGTQEMYEFIDDNPGLASCPIDYTNDPKVIAQIDDMISINAAVEMDLFGQVCAESIGTKHLSGTGGQLDFVEGAYKSKGGQSFICLPSTINIKGKTYSRIKPILTPGAIVTDPRSATDMIVTEYGIAKMKGQNTWQRAENLINIAHPDFRDELIKEAQNMKIWRKSNRR
ncbi:butyryl-CoA:acetate CoA-transferase [Clostridium aestuarii]|uniref:Probable butyrate:acetyl-CoA coenzyme A-transferase n=1 Tax=Clostridium aestuarii TaxID=338193 RepID=A0ABT4CVH9_9CLOT|nr:acetyl-CoA hydrolase/transferase C-terminal domain-containing protein [Clostridium aestuarii]MCY6482979.1 butyryl-CoA:acetate CoA-transferase [Clostridium aestuarii]